MFPKHRLGSWLLTPGSQLLVVGYLLASSCDPLYKNDYHDNSPTSGKLKLYFDEGIASHVRNQAYTFESQYRNAHLEMVECTESEAVQALYNDSCEVIMISRLLSQNEREAFASKKYDPKYTAVAKSGLALISSTAAPLTGLSVEEIREILAGRPVKDSLGNTFSLRAMFDRSNSAIVHYLLDSVQKGMEISSNCFAASSTKDCIDYVSKNPNTIGFIDFAWLSDRDDSLNKALNGKIRFIGVKTNSNIEFPNQSSFKTGAYPFTRTIYVMRKTGDFSLAKGFESFVAGPRGQLTFLKQGLLPSRQAERRLSITSEPLQTK